MASKRKAIPVSDVLAETIEQASEVNTGEVAVPEKKQRKQRVPRQPKGPEQVFLLSMQPADGTSEASFMSRVYRYQGSAQRDADLLAWADKTRTYTVAPTELIG